MSTFCRITGKSRGLPKPNYFPLLPPISPADAKRFCRITGKSYGLPSHHYIPVTLVKNSRKRKCRITGNEATHKFAPEVKRKRVKKKRHVFIAEYRYVSPVLEGVTEQQKLLLELLSAKDGRKISLPDTDSHFVYTVEERNCTLVFSSTLEAAVRDGDIRDIMLDRDSDTVMLKLNNGKKVSVGLKEIVPRVDENSMLFEGEGPSADALKEHNKLDGEVKKRKRADGLNSVKKIFEEKERMAEMQVEKELEIAEQKKAMVTEVKLKAEINDAIKTEETKESDTITEEEEREMLNNWNRFDPRHSRAETSLFMCSGDWRDLLKPLVETWDWEEVENELTGSKGTPIITKLPSPTSVKAEVVNLGEALPGIIQSKTLGFPDDIGGLEPIPSVAPFTPLVSEPNEEVQRALKNLRDTEVLLKTANVKKIFAEATDLEGEKPKALLPKLRDIPDLVSRLVDGVTSEIERNGEKVFGLVIEIGTAKRFVVGQTVVTANGPVFVPGETLETPMGLEFVPGFVVITSGSERPVLIPGQKVMAIIEDSGENPAAVFVAGQTLITREGEKFVPGQTVRSVDGPKFMPGQTVITPDGPKFIPGQLLPSKTVTVREIEEYPQDRLEGQQNAPLRFIPGQTVMTSEGSKFVPGQTVATALGEEIFIAGQSIETAGGWEFVPGQTVKTGNGEERFVAGQTVMTNEGPTFIPGQVIHNDEGPPMFVPGVTIEEKEGTKFVPGKAVRTLEGVKFVEGQIVKTAAGSTTFMPGMTTFDSNVKFTAASQMKDIVLKDLHIPEEGLQPINPYSEAGRTQHVTTLYGHVVQTIHGVEFFPGPLTSALPAGKIVPGKLEQSAEGEVKFFPGKLLVDDNSIETFVPGQMVMTEKGEHFVPGQVVETSDGAKFVPGQVVESRIGPKFVPGQTMETPEGLRFVPGQIVETAAGPTFIPGQIISTEEGSKFVPGEVLEMVEGPRFVPGRVIETEDNRVKFVPGQIVQTKEGQFHFVASDLQDTPGGDFQFSVQGFEVTPEELQLLRPAYINPSYTPTIGGEMSIDSRMLRQLSEAGISLGRQVSTDIPAVDIRRRHAILSEVKPILHKASVNKVEILKDVLQEEYTEESIMERLSVVLKNDATCVSTESQVGNAREQALETAFLHLSRGNPEFMERVLQKVSQQVDILVTEKAATQALQRAIISVVQESTNQRVREILKDAIVMDTRKQDVLSTMDQGGLKTLILQAVGLARALGMSNVATGLLEVLNDPDTTQILAKDSMTMDILRRLTVMRQLAEQNPNHYMALRQLQSDPETAKSDPRLRDLVRESAALMVVPEEDYMPLESSKDIPSALLHSNNLLAMEEFLFHRNQQTTGTILILKPGFQCVIPRENARGILTGQMAFTVLDENGIRHFEPLHVFSALRMPRLAAHHFSMYSCPVVREEETTYATYTAATLTPGSSCDDLGMLDSYMQPTETATTRRRGTLDSIDGSTLSCTRLNDMEDDDTLATSEYNTPVQGGRRRGNLDGQNDSIYAKCNGKRSPTPLSGYDSPNARAVCNYTTSGETSPTYGKYNGNTNGESTFEDTSTRTFGSEVFDVYAVNQSYKGDEGDSISLKKGDLVEVLNSGQESFKLRSRNSSYLLDKYKNLNSYIESGHGGAPHTILKNPRSPSHSSGSAKSLTFDSSRLSGGAALSREDMYGSRVLSPIGTRRTHEYSRAYASPRSYDAKRIHDALVTDTYKLKLNDPSLPYSSPRCYDYLGSCGGSRVYDPLRPFNSRRFYESLEFAEPVEPPSVASPSEAYGYYEAPPPRKITSPSAIHVAYSPNPYDPYAHYNAQPMSSYDPRKLYDMSPQRDIYNPINIRKPAFRLSESPEPFDTRNIEPKYDEISVSRKLPQSPEPTEISIPIINDHEPQFSSTMQRIHIRANILGGKKLNSVSK